MSESDLEDALIDHPLPAPTRSDIVEISQRGCHRTRTLLVSLGLDWERPEEIEAAEMIQEPLLLECAQASVRGVGLLGEQAGQPRLPLSQGPALVIAADLRDRAEAYGFDIQAYRRVSADDRAGLERLCRYLLHPPIAHDRLSLTPQGRVRVRFTRPWKNGLRWQTQPGDHPSTPVQQKRARENELAPTGDRLCGSQGDLRRRGLARLGQPGPRAELSATHLERRLGQPRRFAGAGGGTYSPIDSALNA